MRAFWVLVLMVAGFIAGYVLPGVLDGRIWKLERLKGEVEAALKAYNAAVDNLTAQREAFFKIPLTEPATIEAALTAWEEQGAVCDRLRDALDRKIREFDAAAAPPNRAGR